MSLGAVVAGAEEGAVRERAAELDLPERLTLGLSIEAIESTIMGLPADAVEQCNNCENLPEARLLPKFPKAKELNGYVSQFHAAKASRSDGLSTVERLLAQGVQGVGVANVFVCWALSMPLSALLDALRQFQELHPELPPEPHFWLSDHCVRHGLDWQNDVERLSDCVCAIGRTALLLESWESPHPLQRTFCLKELYCTHASGGQLHIALGAEQQGSLTNAMLNNCRGVHEKLTHVDVSKSSCLSQKDKDLLVCELARDVGVEECNNMVVKALEGALAEQGKRALLHLPEREQQSSELIAHLGQLLHRQNELESAARYLRQAMHGRRATLGVNHPRTLACNLSLAAVLRDQGLKDQAVPIFREVLSLSRSVLSTKQPNMLASIVGLPELRLSHGDLKSGLQLHSEPAKVALQALASNLIASLPGFALVVQAESKQAEMAMLHHEALEALSDVLCKSFPDTVISLDHVVELLGGDAALDRKLSAHKSDYSLEVLTTSNNLSLIMMAQGDLECAVPLLRETMEGTRQVLGVQHHNTLIVMNNLAGMQRVQGILAPAAQLQTEVVTHSKKVLGVQHPDTLTFMSNLAELHKAQGEMNEAKPLCLDTLRARRLTLGERHPDTVCSINNYAHALKVFGDLSGAAQLYQEALYSYRAVLGLKHPQTILTLSSLATVLHAQGDSAGAAKLSHELLDVSRDVLGWRHPDTIPFISTLATHLKHSGDLQGAYHTRKEAAEIGVEQSGSQAGVGHRALTSAPTSTLSSSSMLASSMFASQAGNSKERSSTWT